MRSVTLNGTKWFAVKDVCKLLGVKNVTTTCYRLPDEMVGYSRFETTGGMQTMLMVSVDGVKWLLDHRRKRKSVGKQLLRLVLENVDS